MKKKRKVGRKKKKKKRMRKKVKKKRRRKRKKKVKNKVYFNPLNGFMNILIQGDQRSVIDLCRGISTFSTSYNKWK